MVYWPPVENCQICVSSTSGYRTTFDSRCHRWIYSIKTWTVSAPFMSEIHLLLWSASATFLFLSLAATAPNKLGKDCCILLPSSHLSVQKQVFLPFPTSEVIATAKKALTCGEAWIGKKAHGFSGSVFWSHIHLSRRAHPKLWRSEIPRPPNSGGRVTLGHAIRQCPPLTSFLPFHKKAPSNFVNGLQCPSRKIQS